MMHVAAAGEQRGRVVLHLCSAHPNRVAIAAAMRVAKAFESEVESLFVEDQGLYACASYPFAAEVSLCGRRRQPLSTDAIERQLRHMAAALGREIDALARSVEVPLRQTIVRDEPVAALARACAERGPWNVVALGDTLAPGSGTAIRRLFEAVAGTTGVIAAGPAARSASGPIVVVVEDIADLEPMLRAAERLAPPPVDGEAPASSHARHGEGVVTLLLVAESDDKAGWMDAQVRLALGEHGNVAIVRAVVRAGGEAALAEVLRRMSGGIVIGRWGGLLAPAGGDLRHLTSSLECPLFLMR